MSRCVFLLLATGLACNGSTPHDDEIREDVRFQCQGVAAALEPGMGDNATWRCMGGACINASRRCDNTTDCLDASDEMGCGGAPVRFEVYPSPTCGQCWATIHYAFLPLLEAGLPGSMVELLVVPWPCAETTERLDDNGLYNASATDPYDQITSAQVCVLQHAQRPMPIDSHTLFNAVKFIDCDYHAIKAQDPQRVRKCAARAGLPYAGNEGLRRCENATVGYTLMHGPNYSRHVSAMKGRPYTPAPHVFLNGEPLICSSPNSCEAVATPNGSRALRVNGSLKDIACSMLHPVPSACKASHSAPASSASTITTTFCENCWEAGKFRWRNSPVHTAPAYVLPGAALCVILAAMTLAVMWHRLRPINCEFPSATSIVRSGIHDCRDDQALLQ